MPPKIPKNTAENLSKTTTKIAKTARPAKAPKPGKAAKKPPLPKAPKEPTSAKQKTNASSGPSKWQLLPCNIYLGLGHTFSWPEDHYMVVSCDPAIRNFAIRIEKRYKSGQIIMLESSKIDILDTPTQTRFEILHNFLDTFRPYFLQTHIFVTERQLPKNFDAREIAQHAISYFMTLRKEFTLNPVILDISARNKGRHMGAPQKCTDYWLKKWAVLRAAELFKARHDNKSLDQLINIKKKDDVADTAIQIEALFVILRLPLTENFDHSCNMTMADLRRMEKPKPVKAAKEPKKPRAPRRKKDMKDMQEIIDENMNLLTHEEMINKLSTHVK